jgi:hypothetical protein
LQGSHAFEEQITFNGNPACYSRNNRKMIRPTSAKESRITCGGCFDHIPFPRQAWDYFLRAATCAIDRSTTIAEIGCRLGGYYGTYSGYPGGYYGTSAPGSYHDAYAAGDYLGDHYGAYAAGGYYGGYASRSYITGRPTLIPRYRGW